MLKQLFITIVYKNYAKYRKESSAGYLCQLLKKILNPKYAFLFKIPVYFTKLLFFPDVININWEDNNPTQKKTEIKDYNTLLQNKIPSKKQ